MSRLPPLYFVDIRGRRIPVQLLELCTVGATPSAVVRLKRSGGPYQAGEIMTASRRTELEHKGDIRRYVERDGAIIEPGTKY